MVAPERAEEFDRSEAILDVLGDEHIRTVLQEGRERPVDAKTLADACGVSVSSVYRRLNQLADLGLIEKADDFDITSRRQHYRTTFDTVVVDLSSGHWSTALESNADEGDPSAREASPEVDLCVDREPDDGSYERVELTVRLTKEEVQRVLERE